MRLLTSAPMREVVHPSAANLNGETNECQQASKDFVSAHHEPESAECTRGAADEHQCGNRRPEGIAHRRCLSDEIAGQPVAQERPASNGCPYAEISRRLLVPR